MPIPIEDKVNLICWSADNENFKVLENGIVVDSFLYFFIIIFFTTFPFLKIKQTNK